MSLLVYDKDTDRLVKNNNLLLANTLLKLKKDKSLWEVVEYIVNYWIQQNPTRYQSYIIHLKAVKEDQKVIYVGNKRFRGVSRTDGIERSLVVDFPMWIHLCLKKVYPEENEYLNSQNFFRMFARKYPIFRIRESV